jgi:hypothetical protein
MLTAYAGTNALARPSKPLLEGLLNGLLEGF